MEGNGGGRYGALFALEKSRGYEIARKRRSHVGDSPRFQPEASTTATLFTASSIRPVAALEALAEMVGFVASRPPLRCAHVFAALKRGYWIPGSVKRGHCLTLDRCL